MPSTDSVIMLTAPTLAAATADIRRVGTTDPLVAATISDPSSVASGPSSGLAAMMCAPPPRLTYLYTTGGRGPAAGELADGWRALGRMCVCVCGGGGEYRKIACPCLFKVCVCRTTVRLYYLH